MFLVNTLSQFMTKPLHPHWIVVKHILRYLNGTITLGLRYSVRDVRLHGYTDAHWVGNVVDRKSKSRYCFSLGSAMIAWMSKEQKFEALSTVKTEYIGASHAWLAAKQFG